MSGKKQVHEKLLSLITGEELPSIGPEKRSRVELNFLEKQLAKIFQGENFPPVTQQSIHSLIFLWHDYLDESHSISQDIHSADGSFLHGIMHRREPDYSNAKYWFHRVGAHPAFAGITEKVLRQMENSPEKSALKSLVPKDKWDAFAFIDACERARKNGNASQTNLLQAVQQIEFETLLEHFCENS